MMKGNTVPLEMETNATILDVKNEIQMRENIDASLLKLLFRDDELTDEMTLDKV